jgi:CBS domain-containing protein
MATSVVTVDRATPYKEIARLLAERRISGMPVLKMGRDDRRSRRRGPVASRPLVPVLLGWNWKSRR